MDNGVQSAFSDTENPLLLLPQHPVCEFIYNMVTNNMFYS